MGRPPLSESPESQRESTKSPSRGLVTCHCPCIEEGRKVSVRIVKQQHVRVLHTQVGGPTLEEVPSLLTLTRSNDPDDRGRDIRSPPRRGGDIHTSHGDPLQSRHATPG